MIGVWAITLTTSLSLGVQDTLVKAINSQSIAREIQINKLETGETSYLELRDAPKFIGFNLGDIHQLKNVEGVSGAEPNALLSYYIASPTKAATYDCVTTNQKLQAAKIELRQNLNLSPDQAKLAAEEQNKQEQEFNSNCLNLTTSSGVFEQFYENNKSKWTGSKEAPKTDEIVVCFKCGSLNLNEKFEAKEPGDLIGKTIQINLTQAPSVLKPGEVYDVVKQNQANSEIGKSNQSNLKIVAVVDDRDSGAGSAFDRSFLNFDKYEEALKLVDPAVNLDTIGYNEAEVYVKSYQDLDGVIKELQNKGYLALSIAQVLIQSVNVIFMGLSFVLAGFGFIALVASVFGIVNVMTISVLERKKEIGILKSLGAKNFDIFSIFILESTLLGFLGWLLGSALALAFIEAIKQIFKFVFNSNEEVRKNLTNVNITSLSIETPWWLLLGTLALALFFTIISGVFPALKAARENPVEVLRSE
ncbi:MAG: hypothetical protein OHK0017_08570 [Patescibacteria group bacterium]